MDAVVEGMTVRTSDGDAGSAPNLVSPGGGRE
jgi:hypothetical protein